MDNETLHLSLKNYRHVLVLYMFVMIGLSPIEVRAKATSYEVIGTIKNVSPAGNVLTQHRFDARIEGCKWIIRTYLSPASETSYLEDSFDGDTVYSYIQFTNLPNPSVNTSAAILEKNNVPYEKANFSTSIWLAFASGCYFKEVKDNKVKLFFNLNDTTLRLNNHMVKVDFERSKQPPFTPVYVNFYDDGFVYSRRNNTSFSYQRQSPYDNGFITYKYLATAFTNVGGMTIPTAFQMESYVPKLKGTNNADLKLIYTQIASVESITLNPEAGEFTPKIDAATYVEDRRFASASPPVQQIFYNNTSGKWLATSSRTVMNVYEQDLQDAGIYVEPASPKTIRIVICLVFFLPLLVMLFFVFKRRQSK